MGKMPVTGARVFLPLVCVGAALWLYGPVPGNLTRPAAALPPMSAEARYLWARALGSQAVNPAAAILVSRYRFQNLRPLRSWQDLAALRDYVEWADRPEAAGFRDRVVEADVSSGDLILLRIPAARVRAPGPVYKDPIGFAVLDPLRAGRVRIPIQVREVRAPMPLLPPGLPTAPVPIIHAAVAEGPSIIVLYGESLEGVKVHAFCAQGQAELLYKSPTQINVMKPSCAQIAVEVDGVRSNWRRVER